MNRPFAAWAVACATLIGLTFLCVAWELWLAPLRPGGSWLALKALPLALIWFPLARGARKARQTATLVLPLFAAEALVRALTEAGRHALVAACATVIAAAGLAALLMSFRAERRER